MVVTPQRFSRLLLTARWVVSGGAVLNWTICPGMRAPPSRPLVSWYRLRFAVANLASRPTSSFLLLLLAKRVARSSTGRDAFVPSVRVLTSVQRPDRIVLNDLAEEMGIDLGLPTLKAAVQEISEFHAWDGARLVAPDDEAYKPRRPSPARHCSRAGTLMLGAGTLQEFEPHLAEPRGQGVAVLSEATARAAGVTAGTKLTVSGPSGNLTRSRDPADA